MFNKFLKSRAEKKRKAKSSKLVKSKYLSSDLVVHLQDGQLASSATKELVSGRTIPIPVTQSAKALAATVTVDSGNSNEKNNNSQSTPRVRKRDRAIKHCKSLCKRLLVGGNGDEYAVVQSKWQEIYDSLSQQDKAAVWQYANNTLPHIEDATNVKLINAVWRRVFYNQDNLSRIAQGPLTCSKKDQGLLYCYMVDNQIRYIGQTREKSLINRMTKLQKSGQIGYNKYIKRNLINAYRTGKLVIKTKRVALHHLDRYEEALIKHHSVLYKLWNKKYNERFSPKNYNV